ncbi:MAG TPA: hypothetical protein VFO60_04015, partial [Candidatus Dormibacteraeota bacterium]|nr:hypothetical protein [Candidatus Dormibacteraeota bacterium]
AWPGLAVACLRDWICAAVDVVVHCDRLLGGRRVVTEIAVLEPGDAGLGAVAVFRRDALTGETAACDEVPRRCLERMIRNGVEVPIRLFTAHPGRARAG